MRRLLRSLVGNTSAAVAPTVAMSLFGLIAVGGIAVDYARLASLDTELQQAADQAALTAATQLDRTEDATDRATAAVQAADPAERLAANTTRFANDGNQDGADITIADLTFCSDFDDGVADTAAACTEAGEAENARFVIVTTTARTAQYAFTPLVSAFSGTASATAVAGIESSICNVAPLLVCVPDNDFPSTSDIGKGIIMKVAGGNSWAPGNYGYLDFGRGNQAVIDALVGNGLNGCQSTDDNETEPGNKNATDAINTRMDVYGGTGATKNPSICDLSTGSGCPAENTRKDMVLELTYTIRQVAQPTTSPACGAAAGGRPQDPGGQVSYTSAFKQDPAAKNFGRDSCHYNGSCPGTGGAKNFGNASWNRDAYIAANHPGQTAGTIATAVGGGATASTLTRFQVYQWEIANEASGGLADRQFAEGSWARQGQNWSIKKQCAFNKPRFGPAGYPEQKDRRILPVVAANCDNLKGKGSAFEDYVILRVFDVFLTEPSIARSAAATGVAGATVGTDDKEIYGEVVGPAEIVGGGNGFQYYSRSRPYLVR